MPNFSKDKSGFNIGNPMDKVEIKGKSDKLPGMIGMRSDNPSPNKFLGKMFKGAGRAAKAMLPGGGGVKDIMSGRLPGSSGGGGGGMLEARVAKLEAQASGGGAPAVGEVAAEDPGKKFTEESMVI